MKNNDQWPEVYPEFSVEATQIYAKKRLNRVSSGVLGNLMKLNQALAKLR
jgi:hypothetical protein